LRPIGVGAFEPFPQGGFGQIEIARDRADALALI
jgi:hypothetical protein